MLVKYCDIDGGEVLYEEEVQDIAGLMAIFKKGCEFNLHFSSDNYYTGEFENSLLNIFTEESGEMKKELLLYFEIKVSGGN